MIFAARFICRAICVATLLGQHPFALKAIALPQHEAQGLGPPDQGHPHLVIQPRVGRKGDCLLLHRRVHVHLLKFLRPRTAFIAERCVWSVALAITSPTARRADPLPPLAQARRVDRQVVGCMYWQPQKNQPVRILHPVGHDQTRRSRRRCASKYSRPTIRRVLTPGRPSLRHA